MDAQLDQNAATGAAAMRLLLWITAGLIFVHHVDHVLRYDHSGWPFVQEVNGFTVSLTAYLLLALVWFTRRWRVVSAGVAWALLFALQSVHIAVETPADQYRTWADGVSSYPQTLGEPNLLGVASPALGVAAVAISTALSLALLAVAVRATLGDRVGRRSRAAGSRR